MDLSTLNQSKVYIQAVTDSEVTFQLIKNSFTKTHLFFSTVRITCIQFTET